MISKAVIVFLKVPEKGRVKTRLAQFLDETFVLELYKGFVGDILDALKNCGETKLYSWPPGKRQLLENWLGTRYHFFAQNGNNIGQRMSNAFIDTFKSGTAHALLIGTDIPELSENVIFKAYRALQTTDAVIGPSSDGGYYLIGFQKTAFSKNIFKGIDWSTHRVLDQTLQAMDNRGIVYTLLPKLADIDTLEDLNALTGRVKKGGKTGERTRRILSSYEG